jgi:hypothetical protein
MNSIKHSMLPIVFLAGWLISFTPSYGQSTNGISVIPVDSCLLFVRYDVLEEEPGYMDSAIYYATSFVNTSHPNIQCENGPSIITTINDSIRSIAESSWTWRLDENEFLLPCNSRDTVKVFDHYYYNPEYYDISYNIYPISKTYYSVLVTEEWNAGFGGIGTSSFKYPFNIDMIENRLMSKDEVVNPKNISKLLAYVYDHSDYNDSNSVYFGVRPTKEDFLTDESVLDKFLVTGSSVIFYLRISYRESEIELGVDVSMSKNASFFSKKLKRAIRN